MEQSLSGATYCLLMAGLRRDHVLGGRRIRRREQHSGPARGEDSRAERSFTNALTPHPPAPIGISAHPRTRYTVGRRRCTETLCTVARAPPSQSWLSFF